MQIIREPEEITELEPVDEQLKRKHSQITSRPGQNEPAQKTPVPQLFPEIPEQQKRDQRNEKDVVYTHQTGIAEQKRNRDQFAPPVFPVKQQSNTAEHRQRGKGVAERIEMQNGIFCVKIVREIQRRKREKRLIDILSPVLHFFRPLILILVKNRHQLEQDCGAERFRIAFHQFAENGIKQKHAQRPPDPCVEQDIRDFQIIILLCSGQQDKRNVHQRQADRIPPLHSRETPL